MSSGKKFSTGNDSVFAGTLLERAGLTVGFDERNPDSYVKFKKLPLTLTAAERLQINEELRALRGMGAAITYQEIVMHSMYVDAHHDINGPADETQLHSHSFVEMLYCLSGDMDYLLGTQRYHIRRGDVVIIPPGTSHEPLYATIPGNGYYERIVIWISARFLTAVQRMWPEENWGFFTTGPEPGKDIGEGGFVLHTEEQRSPLIRQGFEQIASESEHEREGWNPAVSGATLSLMVQLMRAASRHGLPESGRPDLLDDIVNYVEKNLGNKITLEETARRFLVSESTLSKTFRARMNTSFYQFVKQRRLIAAKSLLEDGAVLSEIPEQVGFSDYASFYRAFKKEYQLTPSQYRALMQEMSLE